MRVMAGRVTTMGATSMGRVRVRCGSADRAATDRAPPCQMALRAVVDHLQPRKRWAGANETPRGPGSTAAPALKGTVGGGPPPSQIVPGAVAGRLPPGNRCAGACPGATRDPLRPPPSSRGSETVLVGLPPVNICVRVGPGRPRDLVQPPPPSSEALYQWWTARHNLATAWS